MKNYTHEIKKYKTHFENVDALLDGGFRAGSVIILGARPAMGKTSLLISLALNLALKENIRCSYISMEEKAESLSLKILSSFSEVEVQKILNQDEMTGGEYQRVITARLEMNTENLFLQSGVYDGVSFLEALDKSLKSNSQVIFFEHLQMLGDSSELFHGGIWKYILEIKKFAMQNEICVIISSQLTRKVEERQGHRPILSDLRDCGTIEEIADQVFFLLRRDYYDANDKPGMAELILAKNRFGETGSCPLVFRKEIGQFDSYHPVIYQKESNDFISELNRRNKEYEI